MYQNSSFFSRGHWLPKFIIVKSAIFRKCFKILEFTESEEDYYDEYEEHPGKDKGPVHLVKLYGYFWDTS